VTLRDRLVLTGVIVVAILGAAWVLVVSPERKQAKELTGQIATAKTQLSVAEGKLQTARQARARYASAYASIVSLGKAVPTTQEVPSLIYQLSHVSKKKDVDFQSIAIGVGGTAPATGAAAASASPAASTGFSAIPFTFVFTGSYFALEHTLRQLTDVATLTPSGALQASGRLLTIQSVKLGPATEGSSKPGALSASVTASAYQLPPESASALSSTATSSASSASATSSSPTAPAIVRVK
jgi:Tfp pilus assembly protein PilO